MSAETRAVVAVCTAEILSLAGFSLVPALLPQFITLWSLSNAEAGWLAGIMSGGYMLAVLPLVVLTDRVPARPVFLAASAVGAVSCFGIALSNSFPAVVAWRAVSGIAIAGVYMPGLRALTDGMAGARRARAAAWYTSSFTLGSSLSFLLGQVGIGWGWSGAFLLAGLLGGLGVLIAWAALPRTPAVPIERTHALLDVRPVLGNHDVLALIAAYAATIWGTAGLRQWIVVFLTFSAAGQAGVAPSWSMLWAGALIGLMGVPAGLVGNELALRVGLRSTATGVLALSAVVNLLFGFSAALPYEVILALTLAAGCIAQGNYSNLTSGLLAVADPHYRGTTIALYSCIGFAGGFGGTFVFGIVLDLFGGAGSIIAWVAAFGTCGAACLVGCAATALLSRELERPN
jgi:predicted MFS family arabinose efflux permease